MKYDPKIHELSSDIIRLANGDEYAYYYIHELNKWNIVNYITNETFFETPQNYRDIIPKLFKKFGEVTLDYAEYNTEFSDYFYQEITIDKSSENYLKNVIINKECNKVIVPYKHTFDLKLMNPNHTIVSYSI